MDHRQRRLDDRVSSSSDRRDDLFVGMSFPFEAVVVPIESALSDVDIRTSVSLADEFLV